MAGEPRFGVTKRGLSPFWAVLSTSPLVALLAAFLPGYVLGLTGFGFALISVLLLLFVYGPTTVAVLTPMLSNVHNNVVVWEW